MEIEYLILLCKKINQEIPEENLRPIYTNFQEADYSRIKEFEAITNHDVKAIEYFLAEKTPQLKNLIHFALTSEEINNLAHSLMVKEALKIFILQAERLIREVAEESLLYKAVPMPARTHGQFASPTTLGKELIYFAQRLNQNLNLIKQLEIEGKLNGAVGNYNAFYFAVPEIDPIRFSREFVGSLDKVSWHRAGKGRAGCSTKPLKTFSDYCF